jgi:hypothetical protein
VLWILDAKKFSKKSTKKMGHVWVARRLHLVPDSVLLHLLEQTERTGDAAKDHVLACAASIGIGTMLSQPTLAARTILGMLCETKESQPYHTQLATSVFHLLVESDPVPSIATDVVLSTDLLSLIVDHLRLCDGNAAAVCRCWYGVWMLCHPKKAQRERWMLPMNDTNVVARASIVTWESELRAWKDSYDKVMAPVRSTLLDPRLSPSAFQDAVFSVAFDIDEDSELLGEHAIDNRSGMCGLGHTVKNLQQICRTEVWKAKTQLSTYGACNDMWNLFVRWMECDPPLMYTGHLNRWWLPR